TLVQTERITKKMVVVLFGKEFWSKVLNLEYLVETGMIGAEDLGLFKICSDVDEAVDYLTKGLLANSGTRNTLMPVKPPKPAKTRKASPKSPPQKGGKD